MKFNAALLILSVILWSSCRTDFDAVDSTGNLTFSQDTIFLDTVFSQIGSSTYTLKVYNSSNNTINIPTVGLSQGDASHYRLNVDGLPGKVFTDIQILPKDSIFVFIETTVDGIDPANGTQLLYEDQLVFDQGNNTQTVSLITLIQDAHFLFPEPLGDGIYEKVGIPNVMRKLLNRTACINTKSRTVHTASRNEEMNAKGLCLCPSSVPE